MKKPEPALSVRLRTDAAWLQRIADHGACDPVMAISIAETMTEAARVLSDGEQVPEAAELLDRARLHRKEGRDTYADALEGYAAALAKLAEAEATLARVRGLPYICLPCLRAIVEELLPCPVQVIRSAGESCWHLAVPSGGGPWDWLSACGQLDVRAGQAEASTVQALASELTAALDQDTQEREEPE